MSLKIKYIVYVGIIHIVLVGLIYTVLKDNKWLFIGTEFIIIFSLFLSYQLYKSFILPIQLMHTGTDAIADGDFNLKYVKSGSKEIDKLVHVFNDMIDQLRKEKTRMTEQSYFIQNLMEVTPIGIIIQDFDGLVSSINPAAKKILKIKESLVGKNLFDLESELIQKIKVIQTHKPVIVPLNGIDKYKCQISEVIHQGFKRQFIIIDDLSTELLKSEKEAFGRIIRMMAHEVNNSMGAINSILDSVIEFGFTDNQDDELKESLEVAKDRNIGLGKFMANYASILRLPEPNIVKLNLVRLLKKNGKLFQPIASEKNIRIEFELPNIEVPIEGDEVLLEHAISNILKNGIESIEKNGIVKISCTEFPPLFTISDNGPGIHPDVEEKLFTPFFSTKPTGQGVGLMLIRDILSNHNCTFSLSTNQATGWTSFKVGF